VDALFAFADRDDAGSPARHLYQELSRANEFLLLAVDSTGQRNTSQVSETQQQVLVNRY